MSILLSSNPAGGNCSVAIQQILREWPPGYGGVERVAHELSNCWGGITYSLDVQSQACLRQDPFQVTYPRKRLFSIGLGGRLSSREEPTHGQGNNRNAAAQQTSLVM